MAKQLNIEPADFQETHPLVQNIANTADLRREEDGCVVVAFVDQPEALTGTPDEDQALVLAVECPELALAGRMERGEAIPPPSPTHG